MKDKGYWIEWLKAACTRAIRTVAQTAISVIGTSAVFSEINWLAVGSAALLAGILSMLTSLTGLPECNQSNEEEDINNGE